MSAGGFGLGAAGGEVGAEQGLGRLSARVGRHCVGPRCEEGRVAGGERRRPGAGQRLPC